MERHIFHYRCPECHHIVEKEQLFEKGCPICGWTSPLKSRGVKGIPPALGAMADMLPSGTDLNAPGWRELGKKKGECPSCGNEREEKELMEKGCLICGWFPGPKIEKKHVEKKIIVERTPERKALVDIFNGPGYIEVVMDVPNLAEGDIEAEIDPESRKLVVSAPSKSYRREIDLPCSVTGDPIISFKHGTLEVKAKKHAD
jgi:HSP20 family molecular chaperone IbpA